MLYKERFFRDKTKNKKCAPQTIFGCGALFYKESINKERNKRQKASIPKVKYFTNNCKHE